MLRVRFEPTIVHDVLFGEFTSGSGRIAALFWDLFGPVFSAFQQASAPGVFSVGFWNLSGLGFALFPGIGLFSFGIGSGIASSSGVFCVDSGNI